MLCAFQIETINRELDGVLYQALHLAEHGLPTLVGDRMTNEYIKRCRHPLIYFDKDQQKATNKIVIEKEGVVLNLNAEGQGFIDHSVVMQKNFARVIDYVTKICLWGEAQQRILQNHIPESRWNDLKVTGHPSFDLVSPRFIPYFTNQDIQKQHPNGFILINTSFAMFNHQMGFERYVKMLSKMDEWQVYGDSEHMKELKERCARQEEIANKIVNLARFIAMKRPEKHIVIRPHPGEATKFYKDHLGDLPNVFVIKKGTAREWIATADSVIHHDCTTGLEAALMGKVVIQYAPLETGNAGASLMTTIGIRTRTKEDALNHLELDEPPKAFNHELNEKISPYIANIGQNAAKSIACFAKEYAKGRTTHLPRPFGLIENTKCWRKYVSKLIRSYQPGSNGRKVRYALDKFSRIKKQELEIKLQKLRQIESHLPRVMVEQLCLNTFLIRPVK